MRQDKRLLGRGTIRSLRDSYTLIHANYGCRSSRLYHPKCVKIKQQTATKCTSSLFNFHILDRVNREGYP